MVITCPLNLVRPSILCMCSNGNHIRNGAKSQSYCDPDVCLEIPKGPFARGGEQAALPEST